ncbi:MAG: valine--tRNA ligase, partial [Anaerovoracaceae bacterium]
PSRKLSAIILATGDKLEIAKAGERYIKKIANITDVEYITSKEDAPDEAMSAVVTGAEIFIPLDELVDFAVEFERLTKEKKKLEGEVMRVTKMLSNPGFVNKAPETKINEEKAKQAKYEEMLGKVIDRLAMVEKKI